MVWWNIQLISTSCAGALDSAKDGVETSEGVEVSDGDDGADDGVGMDDDSQRQILIVTEDQ